MAHVLSSVFGGGLFAGSLGLTILFARDLPPGTWGAGEVLIVLVMLLQAGVGGVIVWKELQSIRGKAGW